MSVRQLILGVALMMSLSLASTVADEQKPTAEQAATAQQTETKQVEKKSAENSPDAEQTDPTFASRKTAGVAGQIQGEYQGTIGDEKWGGHVFAVGTKKFRAIGYKGGLPGDGWTGDAGQYVSGDLKDDVAILKADTFSLNVDGKTLRVLNSTGDELGSLAKVVRKSKTLLAEPPEGSLVLFDGKSIDRWREAKLIRKRLLGATNCYTLEEFGDHQLHIEFRIPFMPESAGQSRGNSGVYVQSRYEIQVLDSFGLEGADDECGAIYRIRKPDINMCFPPLQWQTYDIDFTAAKWEGDKKTENAVMTVRHNGHIIHNKVELPAGTPGRLGEGAKSAPLFLQNHGNPVLFRNIWAVKK